MTREHLAAFDGKGAKLKAKSSKLKINFKGKAPKGRYVIWG